jgi:hypothetical protein
MGTVAQIVSAVVQIAANYGGTLTQPTNHFNNPVTTGDAIVVFVRTKNANDMLIGLERGATPSAVGAGWTETDTQANNI